MSKSVANKRKPARYYLLGEISKILGVSVIKLTNLQSKGRLPVGIRVGRFHAYPESDFEEIARQCNKKNGRGKNLGFGRFRGDNARATRHKPRISLEEIADADDSIAIEDDE